jgi:hypothetical protein
MIHVKAKYSQENWGHLFGPGLMWVEVSFCTEEHEVHKLSRKIDKL